MPDGRRLARGDGVVGRRDRRVEAARGAQRDREDRAVAVDRVVGEQDRDVQPRLLDRDVLEVVDLDRIGQAEDRADAGLGVRVGDLAVREQLELLELLGRASSVAGGCSTFHSMPWLAWCLVRLERPLVGRPRGRGHRARDQHTERSDRCPDRDTASPRFHGASSLVSAAQRTPHDATSAPKRGGSNRSLDHPWPVGDDPPRRGGCPETIAPRSASRWCARS